MHRVAAQSRFAVAVGGAGFLFVVAALLWAAGVALVDGRNCRIYEGEPLLTGLDTQRSLWPPGAECSDGSVVQLFDGIETAIGLLAALGVAVVAVGVLAAIRDTRSAAP